MKKLLVLSLAGLLIPSFNQPTNISDARTILGQPITLEEAETITKNYEKAAEAYKTALNKRDNARKAFDKEQADREDGLSHEKNEATPWLAYQPTKVEEDLDAAEKGLQDAEHNLLRAGHHAFALNLKIEAVETTKNAKIKIAKKDLRALVDNNKRIKKALEDYIHTQTTSREKYEQEKQDRLNDRLVDHLGGGFLALHLGDPKKATGLLKKLMAEERQLNPTTFDNCRTALGNLWNKLTGATTTENVSEPKKVENSAPANKETAAGNGENAEVASSGAAPILEKPAAAALVLNSLQPSSNQKN